MHPPSPPAPSLAVEASCFALLSKQPDVAFYSLLGGLESLYDAGRDSCSPIAETVQICFYDSAAQIWRVAFVVL